MALEQSPLRELALFAGAGGGILAGRLLGWRTVCAVEQDRYRQAILVARQNDGSLAPFPVWDDVRTFDGRPWRGVVDVVSGGFPCQDISVAGKGKGLTGERSGLWSHMARIIGEVQPRLVFIENSPMLVSRGLAVVLSNLDALGYDATWSVLGASDVGAPHRRQRLWILAHSNQTKCEAGGTSDASSYDERGDTDRSGEALADADGEWQLQSQRRKQSKRRWVGNGGARSGGRSAWPSEPRVGRMAHGVANGVDRIAALGDGQVPPCAAQAFVQLASRLGIALNS